jgi:uncharacterized protein (UPF0332 family)
MGNNTRLLFHVSQRQTLLFNKGYREKSHYALLLAIRELFPNELETALISHFEDGMALRQEADYGSKFSERGAMDTIDGSEKILARAKEILKIS